MDEESELLDEEDEAPLRRRAESVAEVSWRLVCSCMILMTSVNPGRTIDVGGCEDIPLIRRHGLLGVAEIEVVCKVVLGAHGLRVAIRDVDLLAVIGHGRHDGKKRCVCAGSRM